LYQLSDGKGGCVGDARNDVVKSTNCTWKSIESNKQNFEKEFGVWEDWFAYGMHQQGLTGFKTLYRNRNKRVTELEAARQNAIRTNTPSALKVVYGSDFLEYWKERINNRIKEYTPPQNTEERALQIATKIENRTTDFYYDYPVVVYGGAILAASGVVYFIWNKFFRQSPVL
jgi:hypothetical protein